MLRLRYLIQRCTNARIFANDQLRGTLGNSLVVLFGVGQKPEFPLEHMPSEEMHKQAVDSMMASLEKCTDKIFGMRVFADDQDKMNRSVLEVGGGIGLVSQFTLFADCNKGFRPSFGKSAPASVAETLYERQVELFRSRFLSKMTDPDCALVTGVFAARMSLEICNDGPVTILLDADEKGIL